MEVLRRNAMSTAAIPKLKSKKEYMLIQPESIEQLGERLKDQPAFGWEFVQALSHGGKLIAIFSKDVPITAL
jgi:hypothetical protein